MAYIFFATIFRVNNQHVSTTETIINRRKKCISKRTFEVDAIGVNVSFRHHLGHIRITQRYTEILILTPKYYYYYCLLLLLLLLLLLTLQLLLLLLLLVLSDIPRPANEVLSSSRSM